MTDASARLVVTADLSLDVDGVRAQVVGHGDQLRVTTDHPVRLLRAAAPLVRGARTGRARATLHRLQDAGLTVAVGGPRGDLLRLGAQAGPRGVLLVPPRVTVRTAAAGLAAVLIVVVFRRRRHRPRPTDPRERTSR